MFTFQSVALATAGYLIVVLMLLLFIRGVGQQERECEGEYD